MTSNPWIEYDHLAESAFHKLDAPFVEAFNAKLDAMKNQDLAPKLKLHDEYTAQPYFGNPDAKVVVLYANPGIDRDGRTIEEESRARRELLNLSRLHQLQDEKFVYLHSKFEGSVGYQWWSRTLSRIIEQRGMAAVHESIFSAELHPYKSQNYRRLKGEMPTFFYTRHLILQAMERDAVILFGRSVKDWEALIPELAKYKNRMELKSKQNSMITEKNLPEGEFARLLSVIPDLR
jgi:hypothetical protein